MLLGIVFAAPVWAIDTKLSDADNSCPTGYKLMTVEEATANKDAVCSSLGQWDIRRLAGGGSMDGPGYKCNIHPVDERPLGGSICAKQKSAGVFSGKGAAGCTDRACWQEAANKAVNACKAAGGQSCSVPADAADNCVFSGGYTCYSLSEGAFSGKGPAKCTDQACWKEAVNNAVNTCKASGATSCSVPKNASDNCYFNNGYTCYSVGG